jgi:hypothetical protein
VQSVKTPTDTMRVSTPESTAVDLVHFAKVSGHLDNVVTFLMDLSGTWIDSVHECAPLDKLILDLDSSVSETHGEQQGSAYNGYFDCMCYHPLFLFNQYGDLKRAMLRRGNHNSAKFWRRVLLPVIERYRESMGSPGHEPPERIWRTSRSQSSCACRPRSAPR